MVTVRSLITILTALVGLSACDTDSGGVASGTSADAGVTAGSCVPSKTVWNDTTRQMVTEHCGSCHGETPKFGAPHSLLDYDKLIAGDVGKRLVDRMAIRVGDKTMPPAGVAPPPHQVQDTVVEWASCGAKHPDHSLGLDVTAKVFGAPDAAPTDSEQFDLLAPNFEVGPKVLDLYMCFAFDTPVTVDRFVRRIEPVVDDSRVLHHIVLLRDPDKKTKLGESKCTGMPANAQYLYAWAPGAGAIQFPEGGLRVTPGERYIVQIHYNNGAGVSDAKDSSGVRIFHGKPEGTEYGMFAPGPLAFAISPGANQTATGTCKIKEKTTLIAGMPHMHELGTHFSNHVIRKDGTTEDLIKISGWQFELQPFYSLPVTLEPGDALVTSCTWENKSNKTVTFGSGTADEMCFNFAYATPPPKSAYCNDYEVDQNADVTYVKGMCAGKGAIAEPPKTKTALKFAAAPKVAGGDLGKAHWTLTSSTLYLPSATKSYIDSESFVVARGQVMTDGDQLEFDASTRVVIKLTIGQGTDNTQSSSAAGKVIAGAKAGEATLKASCGAAGDIDFRYGISGDKLTIIIDQKVQQFNVPAVYEFKRDGGK